MPRYQQKCGSVKVVRGGLPVDKLEAHPTVPTGWRMCRLGYHVGEMVGAARVWLLLASVWAGWGGPAGKPFLPASFMSSLNFRRANACEM